MYRFLLSPGWLARLAVALLLAAVMVVLGMWQFSRYEQRSAVNDRIDAAAAGEPVPLTAALTPPGTGESTGPAVAGDDAWSRVRATGRYDPAQQLLVRGRTSAGQVGFELVTPLVLADDTAVLVDRGWLPATGRGAADLPDLPATPGGEVTVVGWVHPPESGGSVARRDGLWQSRRVDVAGLADRLPYRLHGGYLLLDEQQPSADPALTPVEVEHENALLNLGYTIQWWIFAGLTLAGFGWLAHREAHPRPDHAPPAGEPTAVDPGPETVQPGAV